MLAFYLAALDSPEDKELFNALYNQHKSFMFRVANNILNDPHLAENIVHDAFVRMMENIHKFDLQNGHKTKSLIGMIVDGLAKDEYRRRKRLTFFDDDSDKSALPDSVSLEEQVIERGQYENLRLFIKDLDYIYANTLVLHFEFSYSIREIAEVTGVTEATVRQRLHRGKQRLKERLAKEGQLI